MKFNNLLENVKKIIIILFINLCLIVYSKADDIRDFQIEGISIGDSLLNFYSKKKINSGKNKSNPYKSDKFIMATIISTGDTYQALQFHFKKNDSNYKIYSISGQTIMKLNPCLKKRNKIFAEIENLFPNTEKFKLDKRNHPGYEKSYSYSSYFKFKSGDLIEIACYDYNDTLNKTISDKLTVSLDSKEFNAFLINEAY
jgi:hypothetical protein